MSSILGSKNFPEILAKNGLIQKRRKIGTKYFTWLFRTLFHFNQPTFGRDEFFFIIVFVLSFPKSCTIIFL